MRTTLDLDDDLLRRARRRAVEKGTTLTAVVEESLRSTLTAPVRGPKKFHLKWNTHRGRLQKGVDISDRDSIMDVMEGRR